MPDKLTDNEIKKALECCIDNTDKTCSMCVFAKTDYSCVDELQKNALDLINRLQAENEQLTKDKENLAYSFANAVGQKMTAKAEAYKEFAEMLDKEFSGVGTCNYGCVHHKTRKVLKELVGVIE